jgi:hypothetical protein
MIACVVWQGPPSAEPCHGNQGQPSFAAPAVARINIGLQDDECGKHSRRARRPRAALAGEPEEKSGNPIHQ